MNNNEDYDDALTSGSLSLFWGSNTFVAPGAGNGNQNVNISLGAADQVISEADGWHRFVWLDNGGLSGGATGSTMVNSLRLDAVNGNIGSSFEVDYLKIEKSTLIQIDPVDAISPDFTLREEWNFDTDAEGWTVGTNGLFTLDAFSGGLLSGTSSGGDPQLLSPDFSVLDVESGQFIIELGLVIDENDDTDKQLFWKLNGGGAAADQSVTISGIPSDGALHVVRLNFDDLINNRITGLRYDPSNTTEITSAIDYIRIYSKGQEIPYFPPPVTELDPAPLGPEFLLQHEWTFNTDDNQEGWVKIGLTIANPNDSFTGVFDGAIFVESLINDSQLFSPPFAINAPSSQQYVIEIDYATDFGPNEAGQLFWTDNSGGPAPVRSANMPLVPIDGGTVRITMTNNVDGVLRGLRIDSTNTTGAYYGIDAVRIYTSGPPVSTQAPKITSFTYDSSTGAAEAQLVGNASTVYSFVSASDLDFTNPTAITLSGATVGIISGGGVETDSSGNATVQFNLGTSSKNFIRAED